MSESVNSSRRERLSSIPPFVIKATIAASLGGILFGYDMGVTSTALPQLKNTFGLSEKQEEMVVSFLYIGCALGSCIGGYLCDRMGRKKMILLTDLVFVLGALILYSAASFDVVLSGRIFVGFAVAVSGIADVAYLHEISPREYRGAIVSCNEACISLGFLLSYIIGYAFSVKVPNDGWRYMFGIGCVIAVLQFICMLFMPESPVWLRQNQKFDEADAAILRIGASISFDTQDESAQNESVHDDGDSRQYSSFNINSPQQRGTPHPEELNCVTMRKYFRQIIIAVFLSVMQHFCGHPNVLNFAPEIFAQIGFDSEDGRLISTIFVGVVKFATVCYAIKKVEVLGRRSLLLTGMSIIAISLCTLSLAYLLEGDNQMSLFGKMIATLSVFGVAGGYSLSFGPLVWLMVSELFPSSIRGRALGLSTIISYAAASLVSLTFLTGQDKGLYVPFSIYSVLTIVSIIFAKKYVPDTGNKSSEEIHHELKAVWQSGGSFENISRQASATILQVNEDREII